jgi:hypothetical protein
MNNSEKPQTGLESMTAQGRIEHLRGKVSDYGMRIERGFEKAAGTIADDDPMRSEAIEAFQHRVEQILAAPGTPDGAPALSRMVQQGAITGAQYHMLMREALRTAASVIDDAGYPHYAAGAWQKLGKMPEEPNV